MKKISKLSLIGYGGGLIYLIVNIIQYYIRYPDVDKLISNCAVAALIMYAAFVHNRLLQHSNTLEAVEDHLAG